MDSTLFGTAVRQGNVAALDDIADAIEGGFRWRLVTTLKDAEDWIRQAPVDTREELARVVERLRAALA